MGIRGNLLIWIAAFLHGEQKVLVEGQPSEWMKVISRVLQGSVLESLLFLIYINDLSLTICLFADDCAIFRCQHFKPITNTKDCDNLQADLKQLCYWVQLWQFNLNQSKYKVMRITRKCKRYLSSVLSEEWVGEEESIWTLSAGNRTWLLLTIGFFSRRRYGHHCNSRIQEAGLSFGWETRKTLQLNTVLAKMQTELFIAEISYNVHLRLMIYLLPRL